LFRHAVELDKDNYVAENVLGKSYERMGNDEAALICYTLSVNAEPRFPQSQFNLAMSLMTFHRTDEALEHLKAAADLDPRDADVQYDLGIYFTQHNSWTNALNCFSNSVSVRPAFAPAQLCMGTALANLDRARDAASHFREALRLDPTQLQARTNLDKLLTDHPELH
jgi:tetratricopeptide (TPR) repeat protein